MYSTAVRFLGSVLHALLRKIIKDYDSIILKIYFSIFHRFMEVTY